MMKSSRRERIELADRTRDPAKWRSSGEFNLLGDLRPLGRFDIVFLPERADLFRSADKNPACWKALGRADAPGWLLYLGGAENGSGHHRTLRTVAG